MTSDSSFGIGCFHFAPIVTVPCRFEIQEHVQEIQRFLDSLETVERRSVLGETGSIELTEQPTTMDTGGFFPGQHLMLVEFTVRIPNRVQTQIMKSVRGQDYDYSGIGTERFKITIRYYFHGPFTVVECLEASENSVEGPSDAVIIVREYLKDKVDEFGAELRFETVGPSPFHADFYVYVADSNKSFRVDHQPSYGYDRVSIQVGPELFKNVTLWIQETMGHDFSFFYSLSRIRAQRMEAWESIETAWSKVKSILDQKSVMSRVRDSLGGRTSTDELIRDIIDFRAVEVFERQQAESQRLQLSRSGACPDFLKQSVKEGFDETFSRYPTSEMLSLAAFCETKSAKRSDRRALLYAAVAGGIVGSLVTMLTR